MYNVDGSRNSFHCFFSGCHKRLRKLNHEEFTLKYRPEFAFNCMQARTRKNFKTFDRTFVGGGSKEVTSPHHQPESRSVELSDIAFKWNQFPNVMINAESVRKGTFFSQSAMILLTVSKNSLWYGELDFLPRSTWLYNGCISRPGLEARWHFFLLFFLTKLFFFIINWRVSLPELK